MRDKILNSLRAHAKGHIEKHKQNVEIYLENPAGIGDHSNVLEAIEHELEIIAKYHDELSMLDRYFKD